MLNSIILTCCIVYIMLILRGKILAPLLGGRIFSTIKSVIKFDVLNFTVLRHIPNYAAWFDVAGIFNVPSVAAIPYVAGVTAVDTIPYVAGVPSVTDILRFRCHLCCSCRTCYYWDSYLRCVAVVPCWWRSYFLVLLHSLIFLGFFLCSVFFFH